MTTLDERLRQGMAHASVQATDLAAACGISDAAVSKWLDGQTKNLKANHAFNAAARMGINADWLSTGEGEMLGDGNEAKRGRIVIDADGLSLEDLKIARDLVRGMQRRARNKLKHVHGQVRRQ